MSKCLLTPKQMAEVLGVPVSWIYRRTSRAEIPFVNVGKYVRFDADEVIEFLRDHPKYKS